MAVAGKVYKSGGSGSGAVALGRPRRLATENTENTEMHPDYDPLDAARPLDGGGVGVGVDAGCSGVGWGGQWRLFSFSVGAGAYTHPRPFPMEGRGIFPCFPWFSFLEGAARCIL